MFGLNSSTRKELFCTIASTFLIGILSISNGYAARTAVDDILSDIKKLHQERTCRNAAEAAFDGVFNPKQLTLDARACQDFASDGGASTSFGPLTTTRKLFEIQVRPLSRAINGCDIETVGETLFRYNVSSKQDLRYLWQNMSLIVLKVSKLGSAIETGTQPAAYAKLSPEDRTAATELLKRTGLIQIEGASERALQLVHEKNLQQSHIWMDWYQEQETIRTSKIETITKQWKSVTKRPNCPPVTTGSAKPKKDPKPKPPIGEETASGSKQGEKIKVADKPKKPTPEKPAAKPRAEDGVTDGVTDGEVLPPKIFDSARLELGGRFVLPPDYTVGIQNFNTNSNPLFTLDPVLSGVNILGKFNFGPSSPFDRREGLHGSLKGEYANVWGDENVTQNTFANPLPTYIDITGTGGFGFNGNGTVGLDLTRESFEVSGELGYRKAVFNKTTLRAFGGLVYRRVKTEADTTLNTNFGGGTFFNTLNEEIREDQYGLRLNLNAINLIAPGYALILGGHLGGIFTNANYRGSDCGDGSIFTVGCDGALFLNSGIAASSNSFNVFGGLKAALGAYIFCKGRKAEILAGALTAVIAGLKEHCMEVSASANYDVYPTTTVTRSTAIGAGQQIGLGTGFVSSMRMTLGVRVQF